MKAKRMSAMNTGETLPELPNVYRQLDSVELLQSGDMIFSQYKQAWFPVAARFSSHSAGNTSISARRKDRKADPDVLAHRRATTKTHGQ